MEDYNRLISAKVLDGYEAMLDNVPQPQMLGGKRMRKYVLPGSSEYDYPGTLSVGRMDGEKPATLGGDFWSDFGDGFPTGSLQGSGVSGGAACGGAVWVGEDGKIHSTGNVMPSRPFPKSGGKKFNLGKALKPVAPIAKELGMTLAKEGIKEGVKSYAKKGAGVSGGKVPKGLKQFGKAALPIAKELGMTLAKEGIKEGVKSYAKSGSKSAPAGGRRRRGVLHSVGKVMGAVGKELAPVAKEVFHDVIVPEGKKALRDYIRESLKAKPSDSANSGEMVVGKGRKPRGKMVGTDPRTYTPQHLLAEGGALIRDVPDQFHSSVYPPALASYAHSFPAGKDAYGRGLPRYSKSPISKPFTAVKKATGGARAARGAIVAEVMKKHGLSLAEASKFVKEKGLY